MERRPWPIVIIAALYLFAPAFNIWLSAEIEGKTAVQHLFSFVQNQEWLDLFMHLFLLPTTAIAIYLCKRWSYGFYILSSGLLLFSNIDYALAYPELYSVELTVLVHTINFLVVSYFMIPAVRKMYFNSELRWWETKPRYLVDLRGSLSSDGAKTNCRIIDISEGGVFAKCSKNLLIDDKVNLQFSFHNLALTVPGQVAYLRKSDGNGYGIRFVGLDKNHIARKSVVHLIHSLELLGVPKKRMPRSWKQDLKEWITTLFKTGRGLVPQVKPRAEHRMSTGALILPNKKNTAQINSNEKKKAA